MRGGAVDGWTPTRGRAREHRAARVRRSSVSFHQTSRQPAFRIPARPMSDPQPTRSRGDVPKPWHRPVPPSSGADAGDDDDTEGSPCRGFPRRAAKHTCIGLLGQGGFGKVYLARQESPRRRVAIKVANDELAERLDVGALLQREAQMLDAVRGPRVAHVYDFVDDGDPPFFAMEFVDGRTLAALLGERVDGRRKALPVEQVLRVFRSLAEAIRDLHRNLRPLIHLDLKPSNVMVLDDDSVKVLDLGLARVRERRYSGSTGVIDEFIGALAGYTPEYASPEQVAEDSPVRFPSDCWSFGVMLFEALTGRLPFGDAAREEYLQQMRVEQLRMELLPAHAEKLRTLVQACLSRDPAGRPLHGTDLLARLDVCLGAPVTAIPAVPNNVPRQDPGDPFVGRERSLRQLVAMLGSRTRSLLVLHGIAGVGKSRLAAQACARLLESNLGDWRAICWVDLGRLSAASASAGSTGLGGGTEEATNAAVIDAIANALQATIRAPGEPTTAEALVDRLLGDRPTLLVLDAAESASAAVSAVVGRLLARHHQLSVLVTTLDPGPFPEMARESIAPLAVPAAGAALETLRSRSAALALFSAIAASPQVRPEFELDESNVADVADLCRRVGGLPLGIRLVAALMRSLTPKQALARLASIAAAAPDGLRVRSLNESIDASVGLAGVGGRALLARLGVFAGPVTLEAIEAICADPAPMKQDAIRPKAGWDAAHRSDRSLVHGAEIWSLLGRLEALGLVQRRRGGRGDRERFQLLEPVRTRVAEKLASLEAWPRLERRFVAWYLRQVTESLPHKGLRGWKQWRWTDELVAEAANVEKLWRLCATEPRRRAERQARVVRGLYLLWWDRGPWAESWNWVQTALAEIDRVADPVARMSLLNAAGNVAILHARFDDAHRSFISAGAIADAVGDRRRTLIFAANRSLAALRADDALAAAELAEAVLAKAAANGIDIDGGSDESVLQAKVARADAWMRLRRFAESRQERVRLLPLCQKVGDSRRACDVEGGLALIDLAVSDAPNAEQWLRAACRRNRLECRSQLLRPKHVIFFGLLCVARRRWNLGAQALLVGVARHKRWGGQLHALLRQLIGQAATECEPRVDPELKTRLRAVLCEPNGVGPEPEAAPEWLRQRGVS